MTHSMRKPSKKVTNKRLVLSGDHLEIYEFENPVFYDSLESKTRSISEGMDNEDQQKENRKRSKARSRKMIRRLTYANYGKWIGDLNKPYRSKFLTLTFNYEAFDVKAANVEFTLFIKRLNYELFGSKKAIAQYLAVVEFQPKSKRVHYHVMLFNLPYIDRIIDVFNRLWGIGFMKIIAADNAREAAQYISKYMAKEDDARLCGEKSYFCSRDLKRPMAVLSESVVTEVQNLLFNQKPSYQTIFETEYTGITTYSCYDISDPNIKNLIAANHRRL